MGDQVPWGVRVFRAVQREPDWPSLSAAEFVAAQEAANRRASSRFARVITGSPTRGVSIEWQTVTLPDRAVPVRVYRPASDSPHPLVLHVHGGGLLGTATQCDWGNSHLAARLPAVVVSVEHRLLAPGVALAAAVDDGWDVLRYMVSRATEWGIDPRRVAVMGESTGGLIAAMAAIRAVAAGLPLRAQVLVNPVTDVTATAFDYPSMTEHADSPMLTVSRLELLRRLAVPPGTDARTVSPAHTDPTGTAPALLVIPTVDPVADHARRYAEHLRDHGTPTRVVEHPGAPHAFITLSRLVPQAETARTQITEFLTEHLTGPTTDWPS